MTAVVQTWKRIMLGLPDHDFFDIIRNYLGPVKTPYDKHTLIRKLVSFIEKNRETIIANIEKDDAALLSAIALMEKADTKSLQQMFQGDKNYLELHLHLLNLEERLLIFRGETTYRINPLLSDMLRERVVRPGFIVRTVEQEYTPEKTAPRSIWVHPHLFFGLISLLFHRVSGSDKRLRKTLSDLAEKAMPALISENKSIQRSEILHAVIRSTGIIKRQENGRMLLDTDYFKRNRLRVRELAWWLLGSYLLGGDQGTIPGRDINMPVDFLNHLLTWLPRGGAVHKNDAQKIIIMFKNGKLAAAAQTILKTCIDSALLVETGKNLVSLNSGFEDWSAQFEGNGNIILSQGFEITIPPQTAPSDYLNICRFAEIRQSDIYATYDITRQSVHNAFNSGNEYEDIAGILEHCTRHPLPQNIIFSLKNWYEEFSQISIVKGMFLVLKPDFAGIIEKSGIISRWILRTLANGIYLMDERAEKSWRAALAKSGIENVPATIYPENGGGNSPLQVEDFSAEIQPFKTPDPVAPGKDMLKPGTDISGLKAALARSGLRPEEKAELSARIEKKVIILADQIRPGLLKTEKSEAKGMDYNGKIRIVEQALKSGKDLLEVQEAKGNSIVRNLIEPVSLDKSGEEVILHGRTLPDYQDWNIAVRKISLLKKLKASLHMP